MPTFLSDLSADKNAAKVARGYPALGRAAINRSQSSYGSFLFSLDRLAKIFPYRKTENILGVSAKEMAKKKSEKLNLKNPKQMEIVRYFHLSEGRMAKEDILSLSNKEIFYRMKNNHYIEETKKGSGIFKATEKLKKLSADMDGEKYSNGCSSKHSKKILQAVTSYVPKEVIEEKRFQSGTSLRQEMLQFKESPQYERKLGEMLKENLLEKQQIEESYRQKLLESGSQTEKLQAEIDYLYDMERNQFQGEILRSDTVVFIPDFAITLTRAELEEMYEKMADREESLGHGKEKDFLSINLQKMESLLSGTSEPVIEVYFEIVTDSYGRAELQRHENYRQMMNREILYIY